LFAYSNPSPSVPTRFSFGTFAFSNTTSEVTDPLTPSFSISLLDFAFFDSTRNAEGPLAVLAKRKYRSQYPPFVVNIFVPLTTHSLPSNRAFVCIFRASDSAPGSGRGKRGKRFSTDHPGKKLLLLLWITELPNSFATGSMNRQREGSAGAGLANHLHGGNV